MNQLEIIQKFGFLLQKRFLSLKTTTSTIFGNCNIDKILTLIVASHTRDTLLFLNIEGANLGLSRFIS